MSIPRRLHFVWVPRVAGEPAAPMPPEYRSNFEGWRALHPAWRVTLWAEPALLQFGLLNEPEYWSARNAAQRADVARYDLVHQIGGIYLDLDVEPLRPLDPLLKHDAFVVEQSGDLLCSAYFGARRGHPAFAEVVAALPEAMRRLGDNNVQSGPVFLTDVLRKHGLVTLPQSAFAAQFYGEPPGVPDPDAFGNHRWAASWVG